jgi:MoaA/NifB/PqqE/SkfB family radical SAM enzyme
VKEAKLTVFPDSLEYRFAVPGPLIPPRPAPIDELLGQLRSIDPERCQRLTISGGSPLKHPHFVDLATECRRLGFKRLALETDAAPLARRGTATLLGRLGFQELFIVMGGLHEKVHDAVLREPGTLRAALEGLHRAVVRAAADGPSVYMVAPLLRTNLEDLDPLLDWAIGLGGLTGILLALPEIARVPAERRDVLVPYSTQAEVAARLFRKCQGRNVEYGFTSKRGILPCATNGALEHFATVFYDRSQYFHHTPSTDLAEVFARVDACADCSLALNCKGVEKAYLEHFGTAGFRSIPLETSMDWKLRKINRLEDFEYRNISPFKNDSAVNPRGLIRINGHCNMSCAFCFVDRTAPDFDVEQLKQEIDQMARGGTRHLVLSGGEPTLHPQLADLIRYAKSLNAFDVIEMQSNGVKCADMAYARELVEAGLEKVTFSLHSIDPEHSDKITRLPKAFGKTIQSIHNFRRLGVLTQIAHVLTKSNYMELPQTVRYLRNEFPADGGHLSICLAIAQGISDLVFHWVIPTFTEIKPYVSDALDFCLDTGVGFGGMIGQGGYPPCMLDGEMRYYEGVLDKVFKSDDSSDQFYKPEKCKECSFDAYCLGPRRSYVEHYGDAEIKPFRVAIPPVALRDSVAAVDYSAEGASLALAESVAPRGAMTVLK